MKKLTFDWLKYLSDEELNMVREIYGGLERVDDSSVYYRKNPDIGGYDFAVVYTYVNDNDGTIKIKQDLIFLPTEVDDITIIKEINEPFGPYRFFGNIEKDDNHPEELGEIKLKAILNNKTIHVRFYEISDEIQVFKQGFKE